MNWHKDDLRHISNLLTILRNGEFKLSGLEALAFSRAFTWLKDFHEIVNAQLEKKEEPKITEGPAEPPPPPQSSEGAYGS